MWCRWHRELAGEGVAVFGARSGRAGSTGSSAATVSAGRAAVAG